MNDPRSDAAFIKIYKEQRILSQQLEAAKKVHNLLSGHRQEFSNKFGVITSTYYSPAERHKFTGIEAPATAACRELFAQLDTHKDAVEGELNQLAKRVIANDELIEAYHRGENILLTKLGGE